MGVPSIGRYALKSTVAQIGENVPKTNNPKIADAKSNLLVTVSIFFMIVINFSIVFDKRKFLFDMVARVIF
jgi:hypothetical protein